MVLDRTVIRRAPKILAFALTLVAKQAAADALATETLAGGGAALKAVLSEPEKHRFQVLYAPIRERDGEAPVLERHGYRADAEYFFPASALKMPIALAAFEHLAALREARRGMPEPTRDSLLRIFPSAAPT